MSILYYLLDLWIPNILAIITIIVTALWFVPGCEFLKFFAPFFGVGLLLRRFDLLNKMGSKHLYMLGATAILFIVYWNGQYTIYKTPNPTIWNCDIDVVATSIYRLAAGTIMTVVLIKIAGTIKSTESVILKILNKISSASLGIYVIHILILSHFAKPILQYKNEVVTDVVSLGIAIIIVSILLFVIDMIRKSQILRRIALGE